MTYGVRFEMDEDDKPWDYDSEEPWDEYGSDPYDDPNIYGDSWDEYDSMDQEDYREMAKAEEERRKNPPPPKVDYVQRAWEHVMTEEQRQYIRELSEVFTPPPWFYEK